MSASNTDLLKKLARKWVGQVGAGGVADAIVATIHLASTTNLPTDTAVLATVDRVDANGTKTPSLEEGFIGVVSGSNLVSCTRGVEGTAQAHDAGAVVEILVTAKGWNDIVDWGLVGHSQLGAHTTDTIAEKTTAAGVTIDGVKLKDSQPYCDVINEKTAATGVTVDGLLIKDGGVGPWDGWMTANETWTYASATTITVPAGAASKYAVGDKIKFTQTTVKYFYITAVADTLLTVTAGNVSTVANAAITNNYYSRADNPIGFPQWFSWTPAYTGFSVDPVMDMLKFCVVGKTCIVRCDNTTTNGTSNAATFTMTLPVAPLLAVECATHIFVTDDSLAVSDPGHLALAAASTTATLYKSFFQGAWTNSGLKSARFTLVYEV